MQAIKYVQRNHNFVDEYTADMCMLFRCVSETSCTEVCVRVPARVCVRRVRRIPARNHSYVQTLTNIT